VTQAFKALGRCRCPANPIRFEYTKRPYEVHYCLCSDCTDVCGGGLAVIAVVEKNAFKVTQNEKKIRNFDTKPTCHRRYCAECGCHMFLYVEAFSDFVLVHVPTLERHSDPGAKPDGWVFTKSKHPTVIIPEDGLPRHEGWAATASPNAAVA
jgi:hypothetical protein